MKERNFGWKIGSSILGLCAGVLFSIGCAAFSAKPKVVMFTNPYPAKAKDAMIDIYRTTKPDKEYTEIAGISCEEMNDERNMEQILIKAREIGADGIIIIGRAAVKAVREPSPVGDFDVAKSQEYGLRAVAIKYK